MWLCPQTIIDSSTRTSAQKTGSHKTSPEVQLCVSPDSDSSACEEVMWCSPITAHLIVISVQICVFGKRDLSRRRVAAPFICDWSLIGVWHLHQMYCSSFCLDSCNLASFWTACSCGLVSLSGLHFVCLCIYLPAEDLRRPFLVWVRLKF